MMHSPTLGTLLRQLVDTLDGDLQQVYASDGLDYRPRYTPIVRVLIAHGPSSIRSIATCAAMTHSAVSQTVALMERADLIAYTSGLDVRERIVTPAKRLKAMLPALKRRWMATNVAADTLDRELSYPLSVLVREAIAALERKPFRDRIKAKVGAEMRSC